MNTAELGAEKMLESGHGLDNTTARSKVVYRSRADFKTLKTVLIATYGNAW
jgi:hypothetical protein